MVLIIGAGLSGLLVAYRLTIAGIPAQVLEARDRIGGRIHTVTGKRGTPIEMGATWFGHQHQQLLKLLKELGLDPFEQYMGENVYFEPFSTAPAEVYAVPKQAPSYRIAGGTAQLVHKLSTELSDSQIHLEQPVKHIAAKPDKLWVHANQVYEANAVVVAMPPKLWSHSLRFSPVLPSRVYNLAQHTQTWMEDALKVALEYKAPFWKSNPTPSTLFSNVGPFSELYDHSDREGNTFALCGFVKAGFASLPVQARQEKIVNQLVSILGPEAAAYISYHETIWAKEAFTHSPSPTPLFPHQNNGNMEFQEPCFEERLWFTGTECAPSFGGYMEGAIISAEWVAERLIATLS